MCWTEIFRTLQNIRSINRPQAPLQTHTPGALPRLRCLQASCHLCPTLWSLYHVHYSWSQCVGGYTGGKEPWPPSPLANWHAFPPFLFLLFCHMRLPWSTWAFSLLPSSQMSATAPITAEYAFHVGENEGTKSQIWSKTAERKVRREERFYSVKHEHRVISPPPPHQSNWRLCSLWNCGELVQDEEKKLSINGGIMAWQTMQRSSEERSHYIFSVPLVFFDPTRAAEAVITGLVLVNVPDERR